MRNTVRRYYNYINEFYYNVCFADNLRRLNDDLYSYDSVSTRAVEDKRSFHLFL